VLGIALFAAAKWPAGLCGNALVTYPEPPEVMYQDHNNDFTVKVRTPGGQWQDLYEYDVKVDLHRPQDASMVYFDFAGRVEVSVRKNNGDVRSVRIRPAVYGIKPEVKGNTAYFWLKKPSKISVEFDGDRLHNLHLFAGAIESSRPDPADPHVMYFGAGVHHPNADSPGVFRIPSDTTVYIDGSAILRGTLLLDHVHDVRIIGRGIIDQPQEAIKVAHSSGISIDGPIVRNPNHYTLLCGESNHLEVRDLKTFSAAPWSDGIDMMSCSDVTIDDVFLRTSDDSIAIYGHRWGFYGDSRNIRVSHAILWADVAHPLNMGLHGDAAGAPETIENVAFSDIDILQEDESQPDYQGCMAINAGDQNLVRNVTYSDVRVDDFNEGQLLNLRVVFNEKYNQAPGRGIENVTFRNVTYNGNGASPSVISGYGSTRRVRNVRFENLVVNGVQVLSPGAGNIQIGSDVDGVRFTR